MPLAQVGQKVNVDISGLNAPGVSVGGGVNAIGTIIEVRPALQQIVVRLDVSFSGSDTVTVAPERVTALL
jgi:hypothetical protein